MPASEEKSDRPPSTFAADEAAIATTDPVVNHFTGFATAQRYAKSRPSGHARVLELIAPTLGDKSPVACALDVGCGTGHSTQALLLYAQTIVGIDSSSEMLAAAPRHPRIHYRKGYAEALPCRAGEFELVTVSSAYHWFDHDRFLQEAARVLRPGGWLVLYKAGAMGRIAERPEFECWRREVLHARYPRVARNNEPLTAERAAEIGFVELFRDTTSYPLRHTLEGYIENLLTHSSVIRVVDGGQEPLGSAREWLRQELAPFFPGGETEFIHDARIHVLRRAAPV